MNEWKDDIRREIQFGGKELPCPFCKVPRVRRSDYIRCARCGINWITGEILEHDPRTPRLQRFLDDLARTATKTAPPLKEKK